MAAEHVLHMQKALDQMNLQIHRVLNDITGLSGLRMLDAILAGERDPVTLARLCHGGVKNSEDTIAKSLEGGGTLVAQNHIAMVVSLNDQTRPYDFRPSMVPADGTPPVAGFFIRSSVASVKIAADLVDDP